MADPRDGFIIMAGKLWDENQQLREQLATYAEHYDLAPHEGCTCKLCSSLLKLAEQDNIIDCYEAMKEGFEIRAGDYETKLAEAAAKVKRRGDLLGLCLTILHIHNLADSLQDAVEAELKP